MIQLNDYNTCIICLQNIFYTPYILNCCNTHYHFNCIKKWIATNNSCPHCRESTKNHLHVIPENIIPENIIPEDVMILSTIDLNSHRTPLENFMINNNCTIIVLGIIFELAMIYLIIYTILYII